MGFHIRPMLMLLLPVAFLYLRAGTAADRPGVFKNLRLLGEVAARDGALEAIGKSASIVIDVAEGAFRMTAELTLAKKGLPLLVAALPQDAENLNKPGAGRMGVARDADGLVLNVSGQHFDAAGKGWTVTKGTALPFVFWPNAKAKNELADLAKAGVKPRTWHECKLRLVVEADERDILFWFEGLLVQQVPRPAGGKGPVVLQLAPGDRVHQASVEPLVRHPLYLPIDLTSLANDRLEKTFAKSSFKVGAIPFEMTLGEKNLLSLKQAGWPDATRDPSSYYEKYDAGPPILHDPRLPFLRVPLADYAAVHVLAVADDNAALTSAFTVQAGRYGYAGQVVQYDFFGQVPRPAEPNKKVKPLDTPGGKLFHVRVPIDLAFAQDLDRFLEIMLTKEIRLARRQPDPCRFRYRPLGLPSGVRIAALTLEKSPLQMHVGSGVSGHAFEEPGAPTFQVKLHNILPAAQAFTLQAQAKHLDGTLTKADHAGKIEPGKNETITLKVPTKKRGYHDLAIVLSIPGKPAMLQRRTSFALLPQDTRKFRHLSPFGTWDFCGGHFTSDDPDEVGPLYVKLGLRYGMFSFPAEARKKYGIVGGSEPVITSGGVATYEKFRAKNPDAPPIALLFHEHAISGKHVTRTPDAFHDLPPYKLDEAEQKRFQTMWDEAVTSAKGLRAKYPEAHIRLGNGALPTREEFYRKKFPAELFDSAGNESASFGRPPEAQPPDWIANNASVWMDRQLLDAYGYKDKAVSQCYEICYPACNPGNVPLRTQADYFVRHALHALAWGIKEFRPGCISDMGNSYYYSNWGATGFCNKKPELNVKPSFVSFATMTRVLDGAKFVRVVPLESPSLYAMEFALPDNGRAFALWTLRGKRPLQIQLDGAGWKQTDDQANETILASKKGTYQVTLSPAPIYLVGQGKWLDAKAGAPVYDDHPAGEATVVSPLATLNDWTVDPNRDPDLEYYNFMTARRKGTFAFEPVAKLDGKDNVLSVKPLPIKHGKDTMPMYGVLVHKKGITLAPQGKPADAFQPTEIGLWIHGNAGWGRVIFDLTDASGQQWISFGAKNRGDPTDWLADWLPKEQFAKWKNPGQADWNTEDVFGTSRINFDGWRYVAFPLPGNYPGEKYPWPANSQWRWDKDGIVHYPLTLKRLIIELPEKVLHVQTFAPPPRPEIYLRDLTVGQGDIVRLKKTAWEERD